ncbi:MAG: hypothetical protein V1856_00640 [Candidatus Liptonbacteria bacterium]
MNKKIIWGVVVVIVLAAVLWWWFGMRSDPAPAETGATATGQEGGAAASPLTPEEQSLGASIYSQVEEVKNPGEQIPDTNPMGDQTNPIKGVYINPFGE